MPFGLSRFNAGVVTRRFPLVELPADPPIVLIVRHAGGANKAWDNFRIKAPDTPADQLPKEGTPEMIAWQRAEQAKILAETCIADWEGVFEDGVPALLTPGAAERFLLELAEHCPDAWYRLLVYVHAVANFRSAVVDAAALGKG